MKELAFEKGKFGFPLFRVPAGRDGPLGTFLFARKLISFREGLPSGLREKGRTVHFPFLPCVLSVLKITDNSIYLLISRLINILYLVLQGVASE